MRGSRQYIDRDIKRYTHKRSSASPEEDPEWPPIPHTSPASILREMRRVFFSFTFPTLEYSTQFNSHSLGIGWAGRLSQPFAAFSFGCLSLALGFRISHRSRFRVSVIVSICIFHRLSCSNLTQRSSVQCPGGLRSLYVCTINRLHGGRG